MPRHKTIPRKNRAYARYRWREKHKRQYTFTRTKFIVGFVISLLTSIFLGNYFEHYGGLLFDQTIHAVRVAMTETRHPKTNSHLERLEEIAARRSANRKVQRAIKLETKIEAAPIVQDGD